MPGNLLFTLRRNIVHRKQESVACKNITVITMQWIILKKLIKTGNMKYFHTNILDVLLMIHKRKQPALTTSL